jgi:hypothetical protein
MTIDHKFPPLDTLENRLGDALGLAIAMLRKPEMVDNKSMAQIEAPFKEWCDALVDGGLLDD